MTVSYIDTNIQSSTIEALVARHGKEGAARAAAGVTQVAERWLETDGDAEAFASFCFTHFVAGPDEVRRLFDHLSSQFEQVLGHLHEVTRGARKASDEDFGELRPYDELFAAYEPGCHFSQDMFTTKIAFVVLLNFKLFTAAELDVNADLLTRETWAMARLAQMFADRIPADVDQDISKAMAASEVYIGRYYIHLETIVHENGAPVFGGASDGLRRISHWGLREYIRSLYGTEEATERQEVVAAIMRHIVAQTIPEAVIGQSEVLWDPIANRLDADRETEPAREPDTRYAHLRNIFQAVRKQDAYVPRLPTFIDRRFDAREIPEPRFVSILESVLTSDVMPGLAAYVSRRLKRPLRAFDIWYEDFGTKAANDTAKIDAIVAKRFPDYRVFEAKMPAILKRLGFQEPMTSFLSKKIVVDPGRGGGHAMEAKRREDKGHLRIHFLREEGAPGKLDAQGWNTFMHELGHGVEGVCSLNLMDYYTLSGVPNTAITEAIAFTFQAKDKQMLGIRETDPHAKDNDVLLTLWRAFEMSGIAMVDINIWHYLYDHPEATAGEIRAASMDIAKDVWNRFFAPVFGVRDEPILAIYSHIINCALYTPDYPLGFLVAFQIGEHLNKLPKRRFAREVERMCRTGRVTPDAWMRTAVGAPISAEPLLNAAKAALGRLTNL